MARSPFSPSPSPEFEPSYLSDSSVDDDYPPPDNGEVGPSVSRPGSPMALDGQVTGEGGGDTMKCQWEDCSKIYNHLPSLIEHIHNGGYLTLWVCSSVLISGRPYRRAQVELYLRVANLSSTWYSSDLAFCSYLAYSLTHWREAVYLLPPRFVSTALCL